MRMVLHHRTPIPGRENSYQPSRNQEWNIPVEYFHTSKLELYLRPWMVLSDQLLSQWL